MTKFGYVRREANSQVDWGAVATQFTTVLQEEARSREEQKAAIDKASREMVETLQNSPMGDYVDGNTFISDYANDAQQVLLTQDRLLKQGVLAPRQYSIVRANLNDSNKMMFKLGEAYQEAYKLKMERMNSADPATRSQMLEPWLMEQAEGLYNLRNTKALINPNDGMVSIGLWKNGKMDTDPSSFATVNQLMGNLKGTYDYYDVRKEVQNAVNELGMIDEVAIALAGKEGGLDRILTTTSQGGKYSGDNETLKNYSEWLDYTSDAMMSNPYNVTSILTNENLRDKDGKQFTFTFEKDPNKRKPNEIYLNRELNRAGIPEFTDEQKTIVKDAIKQRLNDSVDKKVGVQASRQPFDPPDTRVEGRQGKVNEKKFNMLSSLYYGDQREVDAAETYFRDTLGASSVKKVGNKVLVTTTDKNGQQITKEVSMLDANGVLMPFTTFAESAVLLTGVSNIGDSVNLAGGVKKGKVKNIVAGKDEGTYVIEFEGGRKETRKLGQNEKVTDDKYTKQIGKTIEFGSQTATGSGAGITVSESPSEQVNRYYDEKLDSNLFYGQNDDDTGDALTALLSPFGFTVEVPNSPYSTVTIKKGDIVLDLNSNQDTPAQAEEMLQKLLAFVKGNTSVVEAEGQQAYLNEQVGAQSRGSGSGGGSMENY